MMMAALSPDENEATSDKRRPGLVRMALWLLLSAIILIGALIVTALFTLSAIRHGTSMQAMQSWIGAVRPWFLAGQIALIGAVWWKWEAIVKRAKFAPAVETAWLAARNRMFYWGMALVALGVYLWFVR